MRPVLKALSLPASLQHPNWLAAAVAAVVFLQFALNRGGSDQAIWVAGLLLAIQWSDRAHRPRALPRRVLVVLGVVACLLLLSWAFSPADTDTHRSLRLIGFAVLVLAVHHLAHRAPDGGWIWLSLLVSAIVLWQLAARHLADRPFGAFDNPHYLAYFSSLLLPALVLLTVQLHAPFRWLAAAILLLDFDPLLNIVWAPTIPVLAIGAAVAAVSWSTASPRVRWGLGLTVAVLAAALALGIVQQRIAPVGPTVPGGDERVQIWTDTARMIADGDVRGWLVGHGIGSFQAHFARYSAPAYRDFALPHNHLLEVLYENGWVGLTLLALCLGALAGQSLRLAQWLEPAGLRRIARCNLAAFAIWFVFSFLAFGVYSRYTLYPFAILVGIHLFLADRLDSQRLVRGRDDPPAPKLDPATEPCPTSRSAS
jgi:hypothetical protein